MIADAIMQARRMHRQVIEETYDSICNLYVKQPVKDPQTKVTRQCEVRMEENIPCLLSYSGTAPAADGGMVTTVAQTIKLFLAPGWRIPPGSRIEITRQGHTESYSQSGKAAVYFSHQEIQLELWKEYA